jgi:hypothetical protein
MKCAGPVAAMAGTVEDAPIRQNKYTREIAITLFDMKKRFIQLTSFFGDVKNPRPHAKCIVASMTGNATFSFRFLPMTKDPTRLPRR